MPQKDAHEAGDFITEGDSRRGRGAEVTLELLVALFLFFWPTAAEQMDVPHNFWVGLVSLFIGFGVAVRIFWILSWTRRLSRLEKGLIALIAAITLSLAFYGPVKAAYSRKRAPLTSGQSNTARLVPPQSAAPTSPPEANPSGPRSRAEHPTHPAPDVSQSGTGNNQTVVGGDVKQTSEQPCSPNIVGSGNTTNCNPSLSTLTASHQELKSISDPAMPWAVEFTLTTTTPIHTGDLRLKCSGPVIQAAVSALNPTRFQAGRNNPEPRDPTTVVFELGPELFSPSQPVKVVVYASAPVTVLSGTFGHNEINF